MTHINQRRDLAATWAAQNPVLQLGEVGWETDTRRSKLGDGSSPWNDLDYTVSTLVVTKADVGLDQVDNTSDLDKPVSTATQVELDALEASLDDYALLVSPAFTGNPTAPTQATSDDDTSIATTAFVHAAIEDAVTVTPTPDVQVFTADGTWNKPAGAKFVLVEVIAGGGGGGGSGPTGAGESSVGGGGGAGAFARKVFDASDLGSTEAVVVGSGGAGNIAAAGSTGGTSSFDSLSCAGGVGGAYRAATAALVGSAGGAGGAATGGDIGVTGGGGASGLCLGPLGVGGQGAASPFGGGGRGGVSGSGGVAVGGFFGAPPGTGGGGALCTQSFGSSGIGGGTGGPGRVIVTTYFA